MRFADDRSDGYQSYASVIDGGMPAGGRTRSFDKRSRYDISDKFDIIKPDIINAGIAFDVSNDDGRGFRTDTLTSTATRRELRSTSDGLSRKVTAETSKEIHLSEETAHILKLGYTFTWEKSRSKRFGRHRQSGHRHDQYLQFYQQLQYPQGGSKSYARYPETPG